jgi:hypothetical protein
MDTFLPGWAERWDRGRFFFADLRNVTGANMLEDSPTPPV